jgi:hypothetical protein
VKITNTIQGGRGKAGLARRLKKETFKLRLNTCDFGGALHIEHNKRNGFPPPLPFLTTEFVNRVRRVMTCFAALAYSRCSPPFADRDREWNEEAKETGEARSKGHTGEARAKGKSESALDR